MMVFSPDPHVRLLYYFASSGAIHILVSRADPGVTHLTHNVWQFNGNVITTAIQLTDMIRGEHE